MLNVKLFKNDAEGVLQLIGSLDATTSADAENHMVAAAERFDRLILDLEQLEYISSAGLRAIRKMHITMRRKGGTLLVKNASKSVMDVFGMTGFTTILKFI